MRHSTRWRTHLSHDHHIVSKRKWETQSRCPGLSCILHFRTYWPDANFCYLHGPPLSSPPPYLTYHSIHVSSILRAAVAETSTRHWSQWCNEVQWAGNYSTLPRSSNIRLAVITVRSQWKEKNGHLCYLKGVIKNEFARIEMEEAPVPRCYLRSLNDSQLGQRSLLSYTCFQWLNEKLYSKATCKSRMIFW